MATASDLEAAWEAHKDTIVSCFIEQDMTIDELVETMAARGFRASQGKFKRQLKKWNVSKNIPKKHWKSIIKKIKVREGQSRPSVVWFQGRRLPDSRIRKAIQRYDLPKFHPSPCPSPEMMEDIRVSTPPRSSGSGAMVVHQPSRVGSPRQVVVDSLPFLEFQEKLEIFTAPLLDQIPQQIPNIRGLRDISPMIAAHLGEKIWDPWVALEVGHPKCGDSWQSLFEKAADFPFPLRALNLSSDLNTYLWLIEFVVIGTTNGLLRPYEDYSLDLLVDTVNGTEALDNFFSVVRKYDFYVVIEKILDLQTSTTTLFGAQALLSCVSLEDECLLEILLRRGVPMDEVRHEGSGRGYDVSAIHIAVEQQNPRMIRRLLAAGIDPDGYSKWTDNDDRRPLCHLLEVFSIRKDLRVIRISPSTVDIILEARNQAYRSGECVSYIGSLVLTAWKVDAADFLTALRKHCQALLSRDDGDSKHPLIRLLAGSEDFDMVWSSTQCSVKHRYGNTTATT